MAGPGSHDRTLLILDLDETLIHARTTPLGRPADFTVFGYHVYVRLGLEYFLTTLARHFDLAVWSSASDDYVAAVVARIFPEPDFRRIEKRRWREAAPLKA